MAFLVTCEHGAKWIPTELAAYLPSRCIGDRWFCDRGYDVGARFAARHFANRLACPLIESPVSPLAIDCNRPLTHRALFSAASRRLAPLQRQALIADAHVPHQQRVRRQIDAAVRLDEPTLHLAIHSFAPFSPDPGSLTQRLAGDAARRTDLGLLYDPARERERELCFWWGNALLEQLPMIRVRRNYPMRGTREGLTASLRREYPADLYLGIELQMNQAWCARALPVRLQVFDGILDCLEQLLGASAAAAA